MKEIGNFFKTRKIELAVFLLVVLASVLSGVNLYFLLLLILFFGGLGVIGKPNLERLFNVLKIIVIFVFIGSLIVAWFPRINLKREYVKARVDQWVASILPDKTQVEAVDSWDISKDSQRGVFLAEYRAALKKGDTKLAYSLLEKFQSKWDMESIADSVNSIKNASAGERGKLNVGGVFMVGEHPLDLKMGEESDWCIIQSCHAYMFLENSALRITLTFEDGSTVNSWELKKWPDKFKFKVKNLSYDSPVLKVI